MQILKKKYLVLPAAVAAVLGSACGSSPDKAERVREYAEMLVRNVSANRTDSIKASYPAIVTTKHFATLATDSISVRPTSDPDVFIVSLGRDITLDVTCDDAGNITVKRSHGLFAFPGRSAELAREAGMWTDTVSDVTFAARLKDGAFFEWLEDYAYNRLGQDVVLEADEKRTDWKTEPDPYDGKTVYLTREVIPVRIVNNSLTRFDTLDYVITYTETYDTDMGPGMTDSRVMNRRMQGLPLAPKQTIDTVLHNEFNVWGFRLDNPQIVWKISREGLYNKYRPRGDEYDEYLSQKGRR